MVDKASIDLSKVASIKKRQFQSAKGEGGNDKGNSAPSLKSNESRQLEPLKEPEKPSGPNIPEKYIIADDMPQVGLFRPLSTALKMYCAEQQLKMKDVVNEQIYKFLKKEKALPK